MEAEKYSQEILKLLEMIQEQRASSGYPGYDLCQRLLEYGAEENSEELFGLGYYFFAEYYLQYSDSDKVLYCLSEGMKYYRRAGMYDYLAKAFNLMGAVSETQNNRVVALDYYFTCIHYAEKNGINYIKAMAESNIGYIMFAMKRYEESLEIDGKAADNYRSAPKSPYTNWNIALCLVRNGQCYIEMGKPEKALEVRVVLGQMMDREPEARYPEIHIAILMACCDVIQGKQKEAYERIEWLMVRMRGEFSLIECADCIVDLANLLTRMEDCCKMEEYLQLLMNKGIEEHTALMLNIYPYRGRCCYRSGRMDEYTECMRKYFCLYEQFQKENHLASVKIVELREKLRKIEIEQSRMQEYNQQLQIIAQRDSMTGLANRAFLEEYLVNEFEEAYRSGNVLGVELMDIDCFKQYNDRYGHLAGDSCIEAVAGVLKEEVCENIFCARYGGDEFMIIYSNMESGQMEQAARRIQCKVRKLAIPHSGSSCSQVVTVSQGIFCRVPARTNREWDFAGMADITLYKAKRAGRNNYRILTEFENPDSSWGESLQAR